ncbi:MAG TPA: SDR family oxidoreductase [Terriglobia bacterium]|nr:SDR family oxidoreductase [Terriglobia bacterium]
MDVRKLFDLTDRVAVVTGGAGIYGTPISEALAEAGAEVIIASRNKTRCDAQAAELVRRGLKVTGDSYDQGNEKSIIEFRDRVLNKWERIDVFVNNSVARPMRTYNDGLEAWRESMEVNATGLFGILRAFLDPMMKRGSGSIVNISSIQGVVAPDFKNYAGTDKTTPPDYHFHKHGLIGLTKYLAAWAGPQGVRVNAISPGGFYSGSEEEPFLSEYCRRVFLGRMAEHDDIKGAVVFLASEASRYITGQNIIVDGGYTC